MKKNETYSIPGIITKASGFVRLWLGVRKKSQVPPAERMGSMKLWKEKSVNQNRHSPRG